MYNTSPKGLSPDWTGAPNLFLRLPMFIEIIVLALVHMVKIHADFGAPIYLMGIHTIAYMAWIFSMQICKSVT